MRRTNLPEEQKLCRTWTRGTGERRYIDQHILNKCKTRRKIYLWRGLPTKKPTTWSPQSWIIHCPKMYKIFDEGTKFIKKTMKTWGVELRAEGKSFAAIKTQRGIFQGDALSPLLFVIAMMLLNHILRKSTVGYKLSKYKEKINHLCIWTTSYCLPKTKKNWKP